MKKVIGLMATLCLMSGSAFASQISFSHVTAQSTTPVNDAFTLMSFNPALGTLTAVTINFTATLNANLNVLNTNSAAGTFTNGMATVPFTVSGPLGASTSLSAIATFPTGNYSAGPGSTTTFMGTPTTMSAPVYNVPAANFAAYTTASPVALALTGNFGTYTGSAATGVLFGGSAMAGGTTTITYTYTAPSTGTPEPATMSLLGSALVGLGFLKLRKRV